MNLGLSDISLTKMQGALAPVFAAGLLASMMPDAAPAGLGPLTFARATAATVVDHEGVVRSVRSSEARFQGARRVWNTVAFSQVVNLSYNPNAAIVSANDQVAPDGTLTADTVTSIAPNTVFVSNSLFSTNYGNGSTGQSWAISFFIKPLSLVPDTITVYFGLTTSLGGRADSFTLAAGSVSTTGPALIIDAGNGWFRVCTTVTLTAGGGYVGVVLSSVDNGTQMALWGGQVEEVSGQSVLMPSEYIATGVLAGVPYQGANVDGVKYFNTQRLVTQNLVLASEDITATSAWLAAGTAVKVSANVVGFPAEGDYLNQNSTFYAPQPGHVYEASVELSGTGTCSLQCVRVAGGTFENGRLDLTLTATPTRYAVQWTSTQTHAGMAFRLIREAGQSATQVTLNRMMLRRVSPSILPTYTATAATANPGTDSGTVAAIPAVTLAGYLSEPQSTNWSRNSGMVGAASGSPGTLPTLWAEEFTAAGCTRTLTLGITDGMPTLDMRIQGTPAAATYRIRMDAGPSGATATNSQAWIASVYLALVAGSLASITNAYQYVDFFNGAAYAATSGMVIAIGTGAIKNARVATNVSSPASPAVTTAQNHYLAFICNGGAIDFTLRFALPQVEQAKSASSPIITVAAGAVTRNGDALAVPTALWGAALQAQGTCYAETTLLGDQTPTSGRVLGITGATNGSPLMTGSTRLLQATDGTNFPAASGTVQIGVAEKSICAWGDTTMRMTRNGAAVAGAAFDGDMAASAIASVQVGANFNSLQFFGTIRNLRIYGVKLADNELQAMTT